MSRAAWYDDVLKDNGLLHNLALPNVLELAGDIERQWIRDLARGQGVASRATGRLAERFPIYREALVARCGKVVK